MTDLDVKAEGMPFALDDDTNNDWLRVTIYAATDGWLNSSVSDTSPVVEFRFHRANEIDVRWANYEPSNYYIEKGRWPVVRHVRYELHYGVAESVDEKSPNN
uniref:Uncharacterized protein n=1 Tax=Fusarium oxysporum (strain Fo5176) TaxID=660025 RepID=A0A0D2XSW5_FUSOF